MAALNGRASRPAVVRETLRGAPSRVVWWHPSARVDYLLVLLRPVVKLAFFVPWLFSAEYLTGKLVLALYDVVGAPPAHALPLWALGLVYTATLFLASDLSRFLLHHASHRFDVLWQFHQVHHSAEVLTPLSLFRLHPVEMALQAVRSALVLSLVTALFAWLSFGKASVLLLFGVNVPAFLFNLLGANLRHSGVWLSYGARLERWLISPAQHQIHHSADPRDAGKNAGHCLAVWDRLFGTLEVADGREPVTVGLPPQALNHDPRSALSSLWGPLAALVRWRPHRA